MSRPEVPNCMKKCHKTLSPADRRYFGRERAEKRVRLSQVPCDDRNQRRFSLVRLEAARVIRLSRLSCAFGRFSRWARTSLSSRCAAVRSAESLNSMTGACRSSSPDRSDAESDSSQASSLRNRESNESVGMASSAARSRMGRRWRIASVLDSQGASRSASAGQERRPAGEVKSTPTDSPPSNPAGGAIRSAWRCPLRACGLWQGIELQARCLRMAMSCGWTSGR